MRNQQVSTMLAMLAVEQHTGGSDMGVLLKLEEPLSNDRLFEGYRRLVEKHACLRSSLVFDARRRRYEWKPLPEAIWQDWLTKEYANLAHSAPAEEFVSAWYPLNASFPLLIRRVTEDSIFVSVQHAWADGKRGLSWVEALLQSVYERQAPELVGAGTPGADATALGRPRLRKDWRAVKAFLSTVMKRERVARKEASNVVDLSSGVPRSRSGFWALSGEVRGTKLVTLCRAAVQARLGVTQYLCARVAEALSEQSPSSTRVRLCVPVDLQSDVSGLQAGNYVGTLPIEFRTDDSWVEQARNEFGSIENGFVRGYDCVLERWVASADHRAAVAKMSEHMPLAHADASRGYLRQFSAIVTNLDRVTTPSIQRHVKSLTVHGKFEFLILGFAQLRDTLAISLTAPKARYELAVVRAAFARVLEALGGENHDRIGSHHESNGHLAVPVAL